MLLSFHQYFKQEICHLYQDNFHEARVDGRMLNYLTVEDLVNLKVTNSLHLISLKRGIQVTIKKKEFLRQMISKTLEIQD